MDGLGKGRSGAGRFGVGRSGYDGTQPPPPPPLFPDALAGLVTGERYVTKAVPPVVPPAPPPVPQPGSPDVPPTRRAPAHRPVRAPSQQVTGEPAAHVPHAALARQQPKTAPTPHPEPIWRKPGRVIVDNEPKKGKGGLIGCLVVLAALSGLLFNVVREIIEAVVDLVR
ncbi:hypothetical protein [Saccharothrix sp. NRRL B-16348]|uniref:hypothetical protein n=1 Tax=Saccharothrix sp. NRRL B-16348 TaxID=1415542 RepID=UPI000B008280|nr:hypothetical protein [Saccharothrix sp. NRRL B-16348]